jgi:TRAP-type C4-dicarboxylate transport system substrate-binding protein
VVPADISGMKIRPAHATMATFMTRLGATNVQSSAPEVRDILEKGVADAVTFPWGSVPLFGIDKVTKYHMEVPLYATTFAWVMNKNTYNNMSATQKSAVDAQCNTEWALRVAGPWADYERAGIQKLKSDSAHEVYTISEAQVAEWRKAAEPLQATWADNVRKAGGDPDAIFNSLKSALAKYNAAY